MSVPTTSMRQVGEDYQEVAGRWLDGHPVYRNRRYALDVFAWGLMAHAANGAEDTAYHALRRWASGVHPGAPVGTPLLYIYGNAGSGKTHIAVGTVRYLVLNNWDLSCGERTLYPAEFVSWAAYTSGVIEDGGGTVDWAAPLLVLDGLDGVSGLTKNGHPFRLEHLLANLEPRLLAGLPTVVTARRSPVDLLDFLKRSPSGRVFENTTDIAVKVAGMMMEHGEVGCTYTFDVRQRMLTDPDFRRALTEKVSSQDVVREGLFPEIGVTQAPVRF